jgi:hypothetical protein
VGFHGDKDAKLTKAQEVGAGTIGEARYCPVDSARVKFK